MELSQIKVWVSADKRACKISEMGAAHIMNTCLLIDQRVASCERLGYPMPKYNGICGKVWLQVFKAEEDRRVAAFEAKKAAFEAAQEAARQLAIEMLRIEAMSPSERRKQATKLLKGNPTDADAQRAFVLLQGL